MVHPAVLEAVLQEEVFHEAVLQEAIFQVEAALVLVLVVSRLVL